MFLFILSIKLEIAKNIPWNYAVKVHPKTSGMWPAAFTDRNLFCIQVAAHATTPLVVFKAFFTKEWNLWDFFYWNG